MACSCDDLLTSAGVERIATIEIDASCFSTYLKRKLRKQLAEEQSTMAQMTISISLSVNHSGRLFFEAKIGDASLGRGPLRFDATEAAPDI